MVLLTVHFPGGVYECVWHSNGLCSPRRFQWPRQPSLHHCCCATEQMDHRRNEAVGTARSVGDHWTLLSSSNHSFLLFYPFSALCFFSLLSSPLSLLPSPSFYSPPPLFLLSFPSLSSFSFPLSSLLSLLPSRSRHSQLQYGPYWRPRKACWG